MMRHLSSMSAASSQAVVAPALPWLMDEAGPSCESSLLAAAAAPHARRSRGRHKRGKLDKLRGGATWRRRRRRKRRWWTFISNTAPLWRRRRRRSTSRERARTLVDGAWSSPQAEVYEPRACAYVG